MIGPSQSCIYRSAVWTDLPSLFCSRKRPPRDKLAEDQAAANVERYDPVPLISVRAIRVVFFAKAKVTITEVYVY
jgi:hypothetical protein